jgi:hypothetical protein
VVELAWGWTQAVAGPGVVTNQFGDGLLFLAALLYGAHRVLSFHPVVNSDYRSWLATTPWTSRHPLPQGPIHLVLQDVMVLSFLAGVAWFRHPAVSPPHLILAFAFVYEAALAMTFAWLNMPWFAYAIAFGLGLVTLLWPSPLPALAAAFAVYSISYAGLRRAFDNFDRWDFERMSEHPLLSYSQEKVVDRMRQKILGWPFDGIRPKDVAASISYRDGTMLSLLAGWWSFVALQYAPPQIQAALGGVIIGGACQIAIFSRLGVYCWGYCSPIGLWGRIFTLRWIIPGYDQVFLVPLATIGVAVGGFAAQQFLRVSADIAAPATLALILLATLNGAPSLATWRLTGKHRLSPAALTASRQAELKQL